MKFSCDRCGKKYATAEAPAPGRVYKLKCKACGHVIVVKTPAAVSAGAEPPAAPSVDIEGEQGAPPPSETPAQQPSETPAQPFEIPSSGTPVPTRAAEPTQEISMLTGTAEIPKPQEGGYVDLFADSAPPPPPEPPPAPDDPFLKAARGSLPDHFGSPPLSDPFADMREELASAPPAPAAEPEPPRAPPPPAAFAPPPRAPEKKKSGLPVALIGAGVAAVLGIVIVVAVTSGKKEAPPPTPPPPPAPVATPAPPPAPPPAPEPKSPEPEKPKAKAEPKPEPRPEPKRKDDKKVEQAAAEAARKREEAAADAARKREEADRKREQARLDAERKREEDRRREEERKRQEEQRRLAKAEAAKPKEAEKPVQLPDAASALSPEAVQKVVNASRRAFENCIVEAAKRKDAGTQFDGRKVSLRLNVNPNGFVTYPTLDDVTLNRTDLGECLKSAARLMVFPKFQGDVFHVEVPLTLRGG